MENARCYEAPPRTAEQGDPDSPVPDTTMLMQCLLEELQTSELKLSSQGRILRGEETLIEPQIKFGREGRGEQSGGRNRTGRMVGVRVAPSSHAHKASWWGFFQMKASGALTFNDTVLYLPYYKAEHGGVTLRPEIP